MDEAEQTIETHRAGGGAQPSEPAEAGSAAGGEDPRREQTHSPAGSAAGEPPRAEGAGEGQDASAAAARPAEQAGHAEQAALQVDVDELMQAAAKRDEYLALAQRTQADFENYRKRVARESSLARQRGVAQLAAELLPALDNLDRAIDAAQQDDPLLQGVKLVRDELRAGLARAGIEAFAPQGERFDPNEHEAMAQRPVEGTESGCVAEVYQLGYKMGEEVIRPARVLVAA